MIVSSAADDPDACTRFAVTVAPSAIAPRAVAHDVADVVAGVVGSARRDDVILALHEVLVDACSRDPDDPFTVRVRQRDDRTEIEVIDHGPVDVACRTSPRHLARSRCDDLHEEITDAGHVVRLVFKAEDQRSDAPGRGAPGREGPAA